jgi:hypothetical protein
MVKELVAKINEIMYIIKGTPFGVPSFALEKSLDQLLYGFNETGVV